MTLPSPVGWLFDVLGIKDIFDSLGNAYPRRQQLRFLGAAVADNPTLGTTDVRVGFSGFEWVAGQAPAVAADRFPAVSNNVAPSATETVGQFVVPQTFTATYFSFVCGLTPLATDTVTCVVRKNGVDTTMAFVVPAGSAAGTVVSDAAHSVVFAQGDKIGIRLHQSSTTAQANWLGLFQVG